MEKRMLNIKELGFYMGLAEQTIKNKLCSRSFPIPPKRIGRKLLWDKKIVDKFLDKLVELD